MTKTLNQIISFFLHQDQNIFLEKKHNPPPFQVKWSVPSSALKNEICKIPLQIFVFWML
jgi:hypothetical protein